MRRNGISDGGHGHHHFHYTTTILVNDMYYNFKKQQRVSKFECKSSDFLPSEGFCACHSFPWQKGC